MVEEHAAKEKIFNELMTSQSTFPSLLLLVQGGGFALDVEVPEVAEGVGMIGLELECPPVQRPCIFCAFMHLPQV